METIIKEFIYIIQMQGIIGGVNEKYGFNCYSIRMRDYPECPHPKIGDRVKLEQFPYSQNGLSQYKKIWINGELVWEWTREWQDEKNRVYNEWIEQRKKEIRESIK